MVSTRVNFYSASKSALISDTFENMRKKTSKAQNA